MLDGIDSDVPTKRFKMVNSYLDEQLENVDDRIKPAVRHLPDAGGKRLRPVLFLLLSEALGCDPEDVLPIAAGIESFHTSTLVEDDHPDMDNDNMRRDVPTVHREFSPAESQLVSKILLSKAFCWISNANIEGDARLKCIDSMDDVVEELCIGQKQDLRYEKNKDIGKAEYEEMISMKTAAIYEELSRMAYYVSDFGDEENLDHLESFGHHLGMSFQMVDDVIDMQLSDTTGKDAFSDIVNKKITIVTVHAMNNDVPVFDEEIPVRNRVRMIRNAGSIEYGRSQAREHTERAMYHLDQIESENPHLIDIIKNITEYIVDRTK